MKRSLVACLLCLVLFLVSGCGASIDYNAIYGDDAKIAGAADSSFASTSIYNTIGDEMTMHAQAFVGAKTLWRYTADSDGEIMVSYSLSASKGGKVKLVLIAPDDAITILAEVAGGTSMDEMQSYTIGVQKGEYRIKVVGYEDPTFDLVLSAEVGKLVSK